METAAFGIEFFHAKPNCRERLKTELLKLAELSQAEPECLQYDVVTDNENADLIILILKYTSKAAMTQHDEMPYITNFANHVMNDLCSEVKWYDAS
tara:strand:+ start:5871 stop:6158 length:288 start_codon:yes stop_codon:yes gene_type:complete